MEDKVDSIHKKRTQGWRNHQQNLITKKLNKKEKRKKKKEEKKKGKMMIIEEKDQDVKDSLQENQRQTAQIDKQEQQAAVSEETESTQTMESMLITHPINNRYFDSQNLANTSQEAFNAIRTQWDAFRIYPGVNIVQPSSFSFILPTPPSSEDWEEYLIDQ
eukprot:TRINITY_DN5476_c0_g3_i1.p1 TRINITY_DN5476_c0_g3~~TRINITY_DN5476_c0_g3_i1.p1  ORF type:complete len:161 (+),score=62.62 TRINITY_DN5476_c0_g3_i1:1-483(+)